MHTMKKLLIPALLFGTLGILALPGRAESLKEAEAKRIEVIKKIKPA